MTEYYKVPGWIYWLLVLSTIENVINAALAVIKWMS